jgi:hypothetical protein
MKNAVFWDVAPCRSQKTAFFNLKQMFGNYTATSRPEKKTWIERNELKSRMLNSKAKN